MRSHANSRIDETESETALGDPAYGIMDISGITGIFTFCAICIGSSRNFYVIAHDAIREILRKSIRRRELFVRNNVSIGEIDRRIVETRIAGTLIIGTCTSYSAIATAARNSVYRTSARRSTIGRTSITKATFP